MAAVDTLDLMSPLLPCDRAGSGEPLLLLHGLGTGRADFARLFPLLAAHFDVLAVDLPGQGDAAPLDRVPTVSALTDALELDLDRRGLEKVHVLGNSLGARLALELARRGRARSVVAIAPSGLSFLPERALQVTGMALAGVSVRAMRAVPESVRRPISRALLGGLRARPWAAKLEEVDALDRGFGADDFWRLLVYAVSVDVATNLETISCPVTLVQGSADLLAAGQTPRFLAQVRHASFRLLPFAGHAAQGDVPEQIAQLMVRTASMAP